jgi:hypothetical protein
MPPFSKVKDIYGLQFHQAEIATATHMQKHIANIGQSIIVSPSHVFSPGADEN